MSSERYEITVKLLEEIDLGRSLDVDRPLVSEEWEFSVRHGSEFLLVYRDNMNDGLREIRKTLIRDRQRKERKELDERHSSDGVGNGGLGSETEKEGRNAQDAEGSAG